MDEFIWSPRFVRRMALVALINCAAFQVTAAKPGDDTTAPPVAKQPAEKQSLSSFLKNGWESTSDSKSTKSPTVAAQSPTPVAKSVEELAEVVKPTDVVAQPKPPVVAAEPILPAAVDAVLPGLPPKVSEVADAPVPDLVAKEQQPFVRESVAKPQANLPTAPKATLSTPVASSTPATMNAADEGAASTGLKRLEDNEAPASLAALLKDAPETLRVAKPATPTPIRAASVKVNKPASLVPSSLEMPNLSEHKAELIRDAATKSGFGLLSMNQLEFPESESNEVVAKPSQTEIIQSARLHEVVQRLLTEGNSSLRRKANFTARKKATAALRTVVATRDAVDGDNSNSRNLELALDAIRESRGFGVGPGSVDHNAMKRLVAVHKTSILKDQDLSKVSSLGAMSSYLEFAHDKLIASNGQSREASHALIMMGQVEARLNGAMDPISSAITLTYQRAAVDIDPSSAYALLEMGKSLNSAGMADQARLALAKSVELSPSRASYEHLMEAARKLGDIDTVHRCKHALNNANLPPKTAVVQLQPEVFASMHRPQLSQAQTQTTSAKVAAVQQNSKTQKSSSDVTAMARLKTWFTRER